MHNLLELLTPSIIQTIYMVLVSTLAALIIGFPMGILLILTEENGLLENKFIYRILDYIVNISRSIPFIILMILVFPLSRLVVGTTIGTTASIVPLSIAAAPFVARLIEGSLKEVDKGIIEAAIAMGSTPMQIVTRILIPEALPSLVSNITITLINLIGYSAMAGAIGGGGLGDLAIRYGFYRFQTDIMLASVVVIVLLVQSIQYSGNKTVQILNKNR
jgi:D-methionine transport system permease protein